MNTLQIYSAPETISILMITLQLLKWVLHNILSLVRPSVVYNYLYYIPKYKWTYVNSGQGSRQANCIFTSPSYPPNPTPQSHLQLCNRSPAEDSPSPTAISPGDHIDLPLQTSFPLFITLVQCPIPTTFPGSLPATMVKEAGRLTTELHLLLLFNKFDSCISAPPLCLYLQEITQIFSSNLPPNAFCYLATQLQQAFYGNLQANLTREASRQAKEIGKLLIFTLPLL